MAYLQARSGIARSGVTYAGLSWPTCQVMLNAVDRTSSVQLRDFSIVTRVDGTPATFAFQLKPGITPEVGHNVTITYATPDEYLFGGTILQREAIPASNDGTMNWHCVAVGYHWLIDRYARVTASYRNRAVNEIVAHILHNYTNGGFRTGYIPSSLGRIDIDFTLETVTGALSRVAKAVDAYVDISPTKVVNVYDTYPDAALPTITQSTVFATPVARTSYRQDLTQVRTKVITVAEGTTTSRGCVHNSRQRNERV
jgi:hypothetical protein